MKQEVPTVICGRQKGNASQAEITVSGVQAEDYRTGERMPFTEHEAKMRKRQPGRFPFINTHASPKSLPR